MTGRSSILGKDAGIARILVRADESHAGMGIVVSCRHVLTCAHVLNRAVGRPMAAAVPKPAGKIGVTFPLSTYSEPIKGEVVAWHPMSLRPLSDIGVLELETDVPEDVGIATFVSVSRALDQDLLRIFGIASKEHIGKHIDAIFTGRTTAGQAQIDGTGQAARVFIRGGYSGAAVWDTTYQSHVGMVSAIGADAKDGAETPGPRDAYLVPARTLLKGWPRLPVEERRLPPSINHVWTALTSLLFLLMLSAFVWNRSAWPNDEVSALFGMQFYAILAPVVGLLWFRYVQDFKLQGYSTRIPNFANLRTDPRSTAEKIQFTASVFFLMVLPLYAQGHFLKTFYQRGHVYIYQNAFGYTPEELRSMKCNPKRDRPCICRADGRLCEHPDAGRYSTVAAKVSAAGGYWNNAYHYGDETWSVTFLPILQPAVVLFLTAFAILLHAGALCRIFWNGSARDVCAKPKAARSPTPAAPAGHTPP